MLCLPDSAPLCSSWRCGLGLRCAISSREHRRRRERRLMLRRGSRWSTMRKPHFACGYSALGVTVREVCMRGYRRWLHASMKLCLVKHVMYAITAGRRWALATQRSTRPDVYRRLMLRTNLTPTSSFCNPRLRIERRMQLPPSEIRHRTSSTKACPPRAIPYGSAYARRRR